MGMDSRELFERARRTWPTVVLDFDAWCRHLAELGWGDESPRFPEHVYIARACAAADARALRIVEEQFFGALNDLARRKLRGADPAAEALQLTREKLFTGPEPRILTYRGSGHLLMWLKMVLNRVIASSKRAEAAQRQRERGFIEFWKDMADDLGDRPALRPDVVEFAEGCLRRAFATLPARERAVMRLYFLEGASSAAIGAIYGRHRSQIPLWIARGRELMRNELREQVQRALGSIRESELGSLLRIMHDEIDVTISTLLASSPGPSERAA
jgi:RNA polymerase sigma-70 factor